MRDQVLVPRSVNEEAGVTGLFLARQHRMAPFQNGRVGDRVRVGVPAMNLVGAQNHLPPCFSNVGSGCHRYRNVGSRLRSMPGILTGTMPAPCAGTLGVV